MHWDGPRNFIHRNSAGYSFGTVNWRTGSMQFSSERVAIAVFAVVGFGVCVSSGAYMLKIRFRQRRLIRRQSALGGAARSKENNCDERCKNSERKEAKLSMTQGGSPELLTVIHKPWQAYF